MGSVCSRPGVLHSPRGGATANYIVVQEQQPYARYATPNRPPPINAPTEYRGQGQGTPSNATSSGSRERQLQQQQPQVSNPQPGVQPAAVQSPDHHQQVPVEVPVEETRPPAPEASALPIMPFAWQQGQLIGKGAFGNVYKGLVHATGQEVAVKQVSLPRDAHGLGKATEHIRALESEVAVLRTLRHDNIVRYLGTERTEEHLNIFLEFVPGGSIANKLAQWGPLREDTIRVYAKQILVGLEYLHQRKIMHRDIKGANILVDNHGIIKLADFGASKKIEDLATIGGSRSIRGTPNYMAPEVIRQQGHGRAADIWSLGCVVIEMATGRPPWANFQDPFTIMYHIASTKELPAMPDSLSREAREFLVQCFNRVQRERPTASRLLEHAWMQGVQVPRAPPTPSVPMPAPLPPATTAMAPAQQQQAGLSGAAVPPQQQLLVADGRRSPPSPIKEESDSRYGSPAPAPAAPSPHGQPGPAPGAMPGRPPVPRLPLGAMGRGLQPAQQQPAAPKPLQNLPLSGLPPKAPSSVAQQDTGGQQLQPQYDTLVSPDVGQRVMPEQQQARTAAPLTSTPGQPCGPAAPPHAAYGPGPMTMHMAAHGLEAPGTFMTLSGINPMEEPSWMPDAYPPGTAQAFFQQLAAVQESSAPASPSGSAGGAPPSVARADSAEAVLRAASSGGAQHEGSQYDSAASNSGGLTEASASVCTPTTAPASSHGAVGLLAGQGSTTPETPPTGRTRGGSPPHSRDRAAAAAAGPTSRFFTLQAKGPAPQRPGLADIFVSAYDQDAPGEASGQGALSSRQPAPRPRVSASRRALEEAGILLDSTADPARARQWRDELMAELERERMRAATAQSSQQLQHAAPVAGHPMQQLAAQAQAQLMAQVAQRESVVVGMASPPAIAVGGVRPSVADL